MKIYTYWQTASFRPAPPPYIVLCLASMRRVFASDFVLVTNANLEDFIASPPGDKSWSFGNVADQNKFEIRSIVAKSDYLRMKMVEERGGFWLDADTVALRDFRPKLDHLLEGGGSLLWHTEQFFGARPGNELLHDAAENMLRQDRQVWGNPGDLKSMVEDRKDSVKKISFDLIRTGFSPEYGYATQEVMLSREIEATDFLLNGDQCILKLYNTPLSSTGLGDVSIEEFLESDVLLAKVFLSIESKKFWMDSSAEILQIVGSAQ